MSFRLFRKRSVYLPTWRLALVLLLVLGAALLGVFRFLYPFLAVSRPVADPGVIVVDGWMSDQNMVAAAALAREESCQVLLVAGGDLASGRFLSEYKDYARLGEATLEAIGVPADKVHPAPAGANFRHRTFASAAAVHQWLDREGLLEARLMLVTEGPHGRRSQAVYRKVFGEAGAGIGILSRPSPAYDPASWWTTSAGMKAVLVETIALADEWLRDSGRATNEPASVRTGVTPAPQGPPGPATHGQIPAAAGRAERTARPGATHP